MKALFLKIFLILMFVSGILLWDTVGMKWEYYRALQATHIIGSIFASVLLIVPFISKHIYHHVVTNKLSSPDGWIFALILVSIMATGFYLFLVGNSGGDIVGRYSSYIHLYSSFFLFFLFFYHIRRAKSGVVMIAIITILSTSYPAVLWAKDKQFTHLKIENNVSKYHKEDWTSSAKCKSCHSDIFNQWADSNHRNLVSSNPYYMVMEALAGEDQGDKFRQWCMGCHNPSGVTIGLKKTGHKMDNGFLASSMFEKGATTLIDDFKNHMDSRLEEGVSCVACHRITKAVSSGDASYTIELNNRKRYAFEDSKSTLGQWLGEKFINSKPNIHKQSYSNKLYKKSEYCASCHDETSPLTGKEVVSTFKEWQHSPYNDPKNPQKHKDCIDCHMRSLKNGKFTPLKGTSTTGGDVKKDIKVHYFAGSNYFLAGLKNKTNEDQIIQLLKTAAKLDVDIKNNRVSVGVKNVGAGHDLPTGVADFRELWLDVTLKDRDGNIVLSSGKLQADGNLAKDARIFMKVFGDKNSKPVGLMFWRYEKLLKDTRIPAGKRRVESYKIEEKKLNYPLTIVVKLNFRIYPQWVSNIVQKMYPQLPDPTVITLNKLVKSFQK